ncbi:MAG: hypothetical protein HDR01_10795 [Lachnospiraceae bacterium]|nr:hypothetical protein [Lachnospiraceae bacterium]
MAIWQFNCYIIPKKNADIYIHLDYEEILSWGSEKSHIEKIDFLEKCKSWSDKISQYGKEDKTCIEFFYEKGILKEIECRLDLRSLSKKMLKEILNYAQEIEGLIFYESKIYYPDIDEIVELIKKSNANKFCQNPKNYFDGFADNELI